MRVDNVTYAAFRRAEAKDVRYVISVNFGDDADPRMHYFTSHADCAVPATATSVSYDVIESISGQTQRLDLLRSRSDIGGVRFSVIDPLGAVTTVITAQLAAGYGLRQKEVVIYLGGKGFAWSDYVTAATVIIDDREWLEGSHLFSCSDILRTTRKNIFDQNRTNLRNSITQGDTVLTVYSAAEFEFNTHGDSYSDAPGLRVIYVDVDDETIRTRDKVDALLSVTGTDISINSTDNSINSVTTDFSSFSQGMQIVLSGSNDGIYHIAQPPTATKIITVESLTNTAAGPSVNVLADIQFYNCTRGVLNTKPAAHDVDATADADQRIKVTERIYFELPLLKAAYAVFTGNVYGQADPFPDNWHLNISTKWVATSTFTAHPDWWDIADDAAGQLVRFNGLKKRDGKKFVEEQLMRLQGAFMRVQSDGQLAVRRKTRVSEKAAHVRVLDDSNLVEWGALKEDMSAVYDAFTFNWNADPKTGKPNRHITLLNPDSNNVQGKPKTLEMTFEGLSGYTTTQATLSLLRDSTRDMYAGSPFLCQVKTLPSMNDLEIGDVVRWRTPSVRDPVNNSTLDRSFIIVAKNDDWMTGGVVFDLFGSSRQATPVNDAQSTRVLTSTAYEVGQDLLAYLDATYTGANGTKYQIVNGVLHIIESIDLIGNDNLSLGGNYYYHGDVTINQLDGSSNQIEVTINKNVGLWIDGHFTNNGYINGVGRGISDGSVGFIGVTKAGGGFNYREIIDRGTADSTDSDEIAAENHSIPNFNIQWDGAKISGLPNNLLGTGGGQGKSTTYFSEDDEGFTKGPYTAQGGLYGGGGAGLLIVAHSLSMGLSAIINLSGGDGQLGNYVTSLGSGGVANGSLGYNAGSAGGGAGGALLAILDGSGAFETGLNNGFISANGDSPIFGGRLINKSGSFPWRPEYSSGINSYYAGYQASDSSDANYRVQYLMDDIAPSPEPPTYSDRPLTINVQEQVSSSNSLNQSGLEISVNPPGDPTYRGARLTISKVSQDSWATIGDAYNTEELVYTVLADGSTYRIRAQAISINGSVSSEYVETTWTVTVAAGTAVIGSGNVIQSSPTVGQSTNGQGIIHRAESISGYSPTGVEKTRIDASTGKITATDVNLTGSITALAGAIGGWDITSAALKTGVGATHIELAPASGIWFGADTLGAAPFSVTPAGALKASSGEVGGWNIGASSLSIGSGASRIELHPTSGIWFGNDSFSLAPFSITPAGALKASSGAVGGWNIGASSLSIGSGASRIELHPTSGIWLGDNAFSNAPFSVSPAGLLKSTSGMIGSWTINVAGISAGAGASHIEFKPATGIWFGNDSFSLAPFSITPAGALKASSGVIGGWAITADKLSSPDGKIVLDAGQDRIRVSQGENYFDISGAGLVGVDSILGTTINFPTNGGAPTISRGIINSTVFNITSAGIIETSPNAGNGGANGQGIRINNTGIKGWKKNDPSPVYHLDATTGIITAFDAVLTGGGITIDAGGAFKSIGKVPGAGSGVFFGYHAAGYKMDVGDHDNEKFIYFDDADLHVGRNTQLRGTDAYNNNNDYYHNWNNEPIENYGVVLSGANFVAETDYGLTGLRIAGSQTVGEKAYLAKDFKWTSNFTFFNSGSWRAFRGRIYFSVWGDASSSSSIWRAGIGNAQLAEGCGFLLKSNYKVVGYLYDGTTYRETAEFSKVYNNNGGAYGALIEAYVDPAAGTTTFIASGASGQETKTLAYLPEFYGFHYDVNYGDGDFVGNFPVCLYLEAIKAGIYTSTKRYDPQIKWGDWRFLQEG